MPYNPYTSGKKNNTSSWQSCLSTAGMGFGLGGGIGLTAGTVIGGLAALNPKLAGRRIRYTAGIALQSGTMFGVFVAAGFLLRGC
mmetsp:Transcript_938/g.1310  ORF Transcript_938/g.1310 Transcript_938/m.1310 type:complete len:85 (-) Transcript_938:64-318(-)